MGKKKNTRKEKKVQQKGVKNEKNLKKKTGRNGK